MSGPIDWDIKADWMRRNGATAAEWSGDKITSLTLGAAPIPTETQQETQPLTPQQREEAARIERRRIASAASGRPVMLRGDDS